MKKVKSCTMGISEEKVVKAGGVLLLLQKVGVKTIDRLVESQCINIKIGQKREKTKYGVIRHYHKVQYDTMKNGKTVLEKFDLDDYLRTKKDNGLPLNGSPRVLIVTHSGYTFELAKRGRNCYRVKSINNKSVLNSFTEDDILRIINKVPFFDLICDIKTSSIAMKTMNCTPRKDSR